MIDNSSLLSLDYTYHFSKYSCLRSFYFVHVVFCYIVFILGALCFITRLNQKMHFLHQWLGKSYIMAMLYTTASSLVIHNSGLPEAVLISFIFVICGMTIGWILISIHKYIIRKKAIKLTEKYIKNNSYDLELDIDTHIKKGKLTTASGKNCLNRTFSLKSFHGIFMFLSWFNIAGRIFASDQSGDFTCYTYPVYKPINASYGHTKGMDLAGKPLQPLPYYDPNYTRLPWAGREILWSLITGLGPVIFGLIVGTIWSIIYTQKYKLSYFK